tara:strand:+ start:129 stop:731 length:603 start_codon:yes stop_codon:yes gene_type:complete
MSDRKLTMDEIKAILKSKGIKGYSKKSREELLEMLENAKDEKVIPVGAKLVDRMKAANNAKERLAIAAAQRKLEPARVARAAAASAKSSPAAASAKSIPQISALTSKMKEIAITKKEEPPPPAPTPKPSLSLEEKQKKRWTNRPIGHYRKVKISERDYVFNEDTLEIYEADAWHDKRLIHLGKLIKDKKGKVSSWKWNED